MPFLGTFLKVVSIGLFIASIPFGGGIVGTALTIGAMVTGTIGSMLNRPKIPEQQQQIGMTLDPGSPLPVVYGRAKVGSIVADWFIDPDTDAKILYQIVALCHGSRDGYWIGGIDELWINGRLAVTNPTSGNLAESGGNDVREHPFVMPCLDYKTFLGTTTQNVGNTDLSGLFAAAGTKSPFDVTDSGWSATTDTGKGVVVVSLRCANLLTYVVAGGGNDKAKQPTFQGPPAVTAVVRGNFVEDFRSQLTGVAATFTNVGAADTIAVSFASDESFTNAGWQAGDRFVVDGSASNDGVYLVDSVTATTITLPAGYALTNEGPVAVTLYRWAPPENGGDNPALCIRDYLLSTVYGCGYDASLLDEQSFCRAADYCDMLIDYPLTAATEQATRYTCNGVVDTRRSTRENLDALCTSCRGALIWQGGVWRLTIRGQDINQIDNPTFETDIVGMFLTAGPGSATLAHDNAQAHTGTYSLKVTTTNVAYSGVRVQRRHGHKSPFDAFEVTQGWTYTWTCWVYATGTAIGKSLFTGIGTSDITDANIAYQEDPHTLVSGWNELSSTATMAPGAAFVEIFVATNGAIGVFDFWVDDLEFGVTEGLPLTPRNIVGQWSFQNAGNAERWNLVTASYVDPLNGEFKAAQTQWPPIGSNAYLTADNDFLNRLDLSLPFTNDQAMAQAIAQIILNESRNGISCQVTCTEEAIIAAVGDRVTVTHDTPGWDAKPFWVAHVELLPNTNVRLSLTEYQPDAYALDTMEDRRTYAATGHEAALSPDNLPQGFGPFDLVNNGNFEQLLSGWDAAFGTISVETGADRYRGAASIKFTLGTGGATTWPQVFAWDIALQNYIIVRVQPGETLRFSGAAKFSASLSTAVRVAMTECDEDGIIATEQTALSWTTETTWTVKQNTLTVGASTYFILINLYQIGDASGAGSAWLDELHCTRLTVP